MTYQPLTEFLNSRREGEVPVGFHQLEKILGRRLPSSARKHQAWWANTRTHSHAESWLKAGWKTARLDLGGERVVFVRDGANSTDRDPEGPPHAGRSRNDAPTSMLDMSTLSPFALARVRKQAQEAGSDLGAAAAELLHRFAVEERRRLLDWFAANSPKVPGDSTELIREDRDAR